MPAIGAMYIAWSLMFKTGAVLGSMVFLCRDKQSLHWVDGGSKPSLSD